MVERERAAVEVAVLGVGVEGLLLLRLLEEPARDVVVAREHREGRHVALGADVLLEQIVGDGGVHEEVRLPALHEPHDPDLADGVRPPAGLRGAAEGAVVEGEARHFVFGSLVFLGGENKALI